MKNNEKGAYSLHQSISQSHTALFEWIRCVTFYEQSQLLRNREGKIFQKFYEVLKIFLKLYDKSGQCAPFLHFYTVALRVNSFYWYDD